MALPVLPEAHTLASLDPHTLILELPHADKQELLDSIERNGSSSPVETYAHEYRHWLDIVGTLWGQNYLDQLFAAYDAVLTSDSPEKAYAAALRLFDADRNILFPAYYKYVMPDAAEGSALNRWSMSFSTGAKFTPDGKPNENDPILFVRFDSRSGHVARQPVTIGSLLELRATGAEMGALNDWLSDKPAEEQVVTGAIRGREVLSAVYDPQLTTYFVAPHILGYATGAGELTTVLSIGSKLAHVVLNLKPAAFRRLAPPADFMRVGERRLRAFRAMRDLGFAFTALAFALRGRDPEAIGREAIDAALLQIGCPPIERVYADAREAIRAKADVRLAHDELRLIRAKLAVGGSVLHSMPPFEGHVLHFPIDSRLPSPQVITGDCEEFSVGVPLLSADESRFLHECYLRLRESTRQALRAARGLEFQFTDFVY